MTNSTNNNNNNIKPMINFIARSTRRQSAAVVATTRFANSFRTVAAYASTLTRLEELTAQLATLRNFKVVARDYGKARKSTVAKAVVKQAKVRTGVKPVRLTIPATPVQSLKSLRSFGAVVVRPRAEFNFITTLGNCIAQARAVLRTSAAALPTVAQSMVMSIDEEFDLNSTVSSDNTVFSEVEETVEQSSVEALAVLANASNPTIPNLVEELGKEETAQGWSMTTEAEEAALVEVNTLKHREVKTSTYAWKIVNDSAWVMKSSFNDKVYSSIGKGQTTAAELRVLAAKHFFTEGETASIQVVDGIFEGTHETPAMTVKVAVDFNKGKVAYGSIRKGRKNPTAQVKVRDLRKFVVINFTDFYKDKVSVSGLYGVTDAVRLFWTLVQTCYSVSQFDFLVAGLTSKLFIDSSEASQRSAVANLANGRKGKPAYGNREIAVDGQLDDLSREQIIEAHKISVLPCVIQLTNYTDDRCVAFARPSAGAESKFLGTEFQTADKFFSQFDEPIIIDKQAKKWLAYGDGARAAFVDRVKDTGLLISANPVGSADAASKLLNRMASHSYKQAFNQSISYKENGEVVTADYLRSKLQIALKDSRCYVEGIETPVFFSFGDFALNAGTIETNSLSEVKFSYSTQKSLTNEVSLKDFSDEFLTDENGEALSNSDLKVSIQEAVLAELIKLGNVVAGNSSIVVAGAKVLRNDRHFDIRTDESYVVKADDVVVSLNGVTSKGVPTTVTTSIKGYMRCEKSSPKMRGNLKKGTCFPTDTVIKQTGKVVDWTVLLSSETVKGSSGMAELLANHDDFIDSDVVWNKGELLVDGIAIDVEETLKGLCQTYSIERKFDAEVFKHSTFKPVLDEAKANFDVQERDGVVYITETVKGFFSWTNFSVEVSTADENAGYSSLGTNEQHIASWFNDRISNNLMRSSQSNLDKAKYLVTDEYSATVIDISDREAVSELAELAADRTKSSMEKLAMAHPNGVVIAGGGFTQFLPFGVLLHFGNWDGNHPGSSAAPVDVAEEDELQTSNICCEVFDFINSVNQQWVIDFSDSVEVRQLIASLNGLRGWVSAVKDRSASKLMKVDGIKGKKRKGKKFNYHLKVVGNTMLGMESGLPVVEIHPNNPSGYRDGSKVLLARCPLPLYTACVVRHNDSLDSSVVAVNPLIWSASNAGDNDGDLAYLLNLFVACGSEVETTTCAIYNEKFSGLATHWEVFSKVDDKGRKPFSPLLDNLGKGSSASLEEKDASVSKLSIVGATITHQHIALIPSIQKHYAIGVGEFHKVATALTESEGNKVHSFSEVPRASVVAIHQAWFDYEEFGLGGWTVHNSEVLAGLKSQITSEVINPGSFKPRNSRRGKTSTPSVNLLAIQASALVELGGRVMKDEAGATDKALLAQALKRLAKKEIVKGEYKLWQATRSVIDRNPNILEGYRFGEHIKVLGQIRLDSILS